MSKYDITAGYVTTPAGPGKYVHYDAAKGKVIVEHDFTHLVEYPAEEVYIND